MLFQSAKFLISVAKPQQFPRDEGYEVAFAGRSNAGKSSVINALTRQKQLARSSKTPGRTQLVNFFTLDDERRLIDLPGYGYAKVSASVKKDWAPLIDSYLSARECLRGVILIMDIRHPLKEFDQQMLGWSGAANIPLHILLNKADKLKFGQQKSVLMQVNQVLQNFPEASCQIFSALKNIGLDELESKLTAWYKEDKASNI